MILILLLFSLGHAIKPIECDRVLYNQYRPDNLSAYDQLIFYEYMPDYKKCGVTNWFIVNTSETNGIDQIHYKIGEWHYFKFRVYDTKKIVIVRSKVYTKSVTLTDPERDNKLFLLDKDRLSLW